MVAKTKRKPAPNEILKHYVQMADEYEQLLAWTRELEAEGKMREAQSTLAAAENLHRQIEQFERNHWPVQLKP